MKVTHEGDKYFVDIDERQKFCIPDNSVGLLPFVHAAIVEFHDRPKAIERRARTMCEAAGYTWVNGAMGAGWICAAELEWEAERGERSAR